MKLRTLFLIGASFLVSSSVAGAFSGFVSKIPNGSKFSCSACHTSVPDLNSFGLQVQQYLVGGNVDWPSLYNLDADGDGYSNGAELQDPTGVWTSGAIGDASKVTNPGDASSHPTSVFESSGSIVDKLTVDIPASSSIAMLKFSLSTPGNTYAVVYDVMGNTVLKTEYGNLADGSYNMLLPLTNEDGTAIGNGVFFVRIVSGSTVRTAKIVL